MNDINELENEIKELTKQLRRAERKIMTLESENKMMASLNRKAIRMRDFSEREQMRAKEMAEHADRAKSDFLASMSHEIRTPINAVLGMNELIMREATEPQVLEYAADIKSSGRMLLSIINDILDFSKIESGKMDIIPVRYDLTSLICDVMNMLSKRASDKGLEFIIDVDKSLPSVLLGDEIRIRQIMMNLLTNAIKYTDAGRVELIVSGEKNENNLKLKISVSDTGKGIREEDQSKLFNSFTRVDEKANRTIEGTGLGLALTKRFVEMMNGELTLESVYGEGSTFTVWLEQKIVNKEPLGDFAEYVKKNRVRASAEVYDIYAPGCRLLVVDDIEMNCKVICGLLKKSGIIIDTALSGAQALKKCRSNKYDLIFMDHRMPHMDGIECFHELKKMDTPNNSTPVVALTANALSGMREMYMHEGFADYLTKPVEVRKLDASLHRIIPELLKERNKEVPAATDFQSVSEDNNKDSLSEILAEDEKGTQNGLAQMYPELDVESGLFFCMNSEEFYREMLREYVKNDRRSHIKEALENKDYKNFKTYVHGVKSTSANIGGKSISEKAKALEMAAGEENVSYIEENFEEFFSEYDALLEHIKKEEIK